MRLDADVVQRDSEALSAHRIHHVAKLTHIRRALRLDDLEYHSLAWNVHRFDSANGRPQRARSLAHRFSREVEEERAPLLLARRDADGRAARRAVELREHAAVARRLEKPAGRHRLAVLADATHE